MEWGGKWDNCNSIINKYIKKKKKIKNKIKKKKKKKSHCQNLEEEIMPEQSE